MPSRPIPFPLWWILEFRTILLSALFAALSLTACDKPTVVNVPADTVVVPVPGPAGAPGEPGKTGDQGTQGNTGNTGTKGNEGAQGEAGKTGDNTTIVVVPPAEPAPAN